MRISRVLLSAVALVVATLGLGASPASALNHDTYNILKNADLHQYCLDMKLEAPFAGRGQLWTCTHPVVGEQLFILVSDGFGHDHIKIRRSGQCLDYFPGLLGGVGQQPCDFGDPRQSWDLRDTGEIVNVADGRCLDPLQPDVKRSEIVTNDCNGNISQRWFF